MAVCRNCQMIINSCLWQDWYKRSQYTQQSTVSSLYNNAWRTETRLQVSPWMSQTSDCHLAVVFARFLEAADGSMRWYFCTLLPATFAFLWITPILIPLRYQPQQQFAATCFFGCCTPCPLTAQILWRILPIWNPFWLNIPCSQAVIDACSPKQS